MIIRLAKCWIQYYQLYAYPTASSTTWDRTDVINCSLFTPYKGGWSRNTFNVSAWKVWHTFPCCSFSSPPHLPSIFNGISTHTPSPISPHNALLSVCPLVMAVPRYNASPPPVLIWRTVMQILGSTRISGGRSFSRSSPSPLIMQR